jgi:hypothetical protein
MSGKILKAFVWKRAKWFVSPEQLNVERKTVMLLAV